MAWLRLDDGFDSHPKLLELTEVQRWRWTRVLIHCARHRTEGLVTTSALRELGLARSTQQLIRLGLLDQDECGYVVHDWSVYNSSTIGERVAGYLATHADASANEVHKAIGGTRNIVLSEVARQRRTGTAPGTAEPSAGGTAGGSEGGTGSVRTEPVSRYGIGTHAREPVPSPEELPKAVPVSRHAAEPEPSLSDDEPVDDDRTAFDHFIDFIDTVELREMP